MPIKEGQKIKLTNSATYQRSSDQENVYVNSAKFVKCTSVDDQIYLDMGPVRLIVTDKGKQWIRGFFCRSMTSSIKDVTMCL